MKLKILGLLIIFSIFIGNTSAISNFTQNIDINSVLDNEAGISAYTKADKSINIENAKNAFRTIETKTSEYIIGSVEIPGLPESEDAHVYVNRSGWILAYYLKDAPVSKMVKYDGGTITTTLADAVTKVAASAGVQYSDLKYYDFKYSGANRLMMIGDWRLNGEPADSYRFKIPSTFTLNENSHSIRCRGNCWINLDGTGTRYNDWFGHYTMPVASISYGYYPNILSPDAFHTVDYSMDYEGGHVTVLVYREP